MKFADFLSLGNAVFGILSLTQLVYGGTKLAGVFLLIAIIFDSIDGKFSKGGTEFGKQMDSLCDIVSFGVVPTFIAYTFLPGMWKIISFLIIITGVYRLARYNTTDQSKIFMGVPITFTALVFSILLITGFVDQYLIAALSVILSLGMASKIKIKRI